MKRVSGECGWILERVWEGCIGSVEIVCGEFGESVGLMWKECEDIVGRVMREC